MVPHLVLEAMEVEYELILVDRKSKAQKSNEYLALNPTGRIPTLVGDGLVIFESAAICLHLCDSNCTSTLIPSVTSQDRPIFYQWLMYLNSSVQSELMIYFYPEKHTSNTESIAAIVDMQESRICKMFELLDKELQDKSYLVGNNMTVCDYYLFMLSVWADELKHPPLSFPNLSRYLKGLAKSPTVITVCKKEGISLADYR